MDLTELRNKYELLDIFCSLAEIPSPSLKEDKVIESYVNPFKIGDNVYHTNLGKGVVLSVNGEGADCLAKVEFEGRFIKKIHPIYLSPYNERMA